jgi:plasmid stabilization system protein ParE
MAYRVDISQPATTDAENAFLWIRAESEDKAVAWFQGLLKAVNSLAKFPERCPLAPESRAFLVEVRQFLYGKRRHQYRILFGISIDPETGENVVLIYRIRHGAQRYLEGLEILGEPEL